MRYAKLVFLAFILSVLPGLTLVNVFADDAPAAGGEQGAVQPPAAEQPKEEKPPVSDVEPAGGAFDTLKKLQAAGYDKLYYVILRNFEVIGWAKSELAVGVYENQPVIEQTIASSLDTTGQVEGKIYYNAQLEVQGLTESATKGNQTTTLKATRSGKALEVEVQPGGGEVTKTEVIVEGLPDPPVNIYALVLRYFDKVLQENATISVLNDNNLSAFAAATAQLQGKMTCIADAARLAQCLVCMPDQANRYMLDSTSGIVVRKDISPNMQTAALQVMIDKDTFDNWLVNGKWTEAAKALSANAATLLPEPSQPIADWGAKRGELAKYWKDLADKIPADMIDGIKAFVGTGYGIVNPREVPQETKDKLAQYGDNVLYYVMSQTLNNTNTNDQEGTMARFSISRLLPIIFPDKFPDPVRDTIIAIMYDEQMGIDQQSLGLLVERNWDATLQDVLLDTLKNTKSDGIASIIAGLLFFKHPAWADRLGLYVLATPFTNKYFAVRNMDTTVEAPIFIGLLLERWRLSAMYTADVDAFTALQKILGQEAAGNDANELYCKWQTALFSQGAVPDDVKAKANDLFVKLDAEDLGTREQAKKDLVAMGKVILPLLEIQRDNNSPEVREAVAAVTDLIVAPGYSKIVDFIRKNQYDRNLILFIGYLDCETPSSRALAAARLKELTGQDFGDDLAKWYNWYAANKDKLKWNKDKNMWVTE